MSYKCTLTFLNQMERKKKIIDMEPQILKGKNSNRMLQHKRPRVLFHMDNTNKD